MKLIHTADWHLGHIFYGHSRTEEHAHFFQWLLALLGTEQPDALIISGDVYDSANPPAGAEAQLFDFLVEATERVPGLQVVVTAGNHDSASRLEAPARLLKLHNVYVKGLVRHDEKGVPCFDDYILPLSRNNTSEAECVCLAVPYLRASDYPAGLTPEQGLKYFTDGLRQALKKSDFKNLPTFLAAHFYAVGAEVNETEHSERLVVGGQDCVPVEALGAGNVYTALGHIHKAQQVGRTSKVTNAYYAGSVLPMSFAETNYHHGVNIVEFPTGHDLSSAPSGAATVRRADYTPLRGLLRIPKTGAASVMQALDVMAALPVRKTAEADAWPYLEICIAEDRPEPTLLRDINEILEEKGVRFCRIIRRNELTAAAPPAPASPDMLSTFSPADLAQRIFRERFEQDMPAEMQTRLDEVINDKNGD